MYKLPTYPYTVPRHHKAVAQQPPGNHGYLGRATLSKKTEMNSADLTLQPFSPHKSGFKLSRTPHAPRHKISVTSSPRRPMSPVLSGHWKAVGGSEGRNELVQQLLNQHKCHEREPPLISSTNTVAMKPSLSPTPCSEGAECKGEEGKAGGGSHYAMNGCGEAAMEEGEEGLKVGMKSGGNRAREAWGDPEKVYRMGPWQWVCRHLSFMLLSCGNR